jgi:hypothetical protein
VIVHVYHSFTCHSRDWQIPDALPGDPSLSYSYAGEERWFGRQMAKIPVPGLEHINMDHSFDLQHRPVHLNAMPKHLHAR